MDNHDANMESGNEVDERDDVIAQSHEELEALRKRISTENADNPID